MAGEATGGAIPRSADMPRYFFDLVNGSGVTADEEGSELSDAQAARDCAVRQLRSILAHDVLNGQLDCNLRIVVRSGDGEQVLDVGFRDAVELIPEQDREGRE